MEETPLSFVKKIELKLENSLELAQKLIEPALKNYKGEEILFKKKDLNLFTEFLVGSNANQSRISITLAPEVNNTTKMILEIISTGPLSRGEVVSRMPKKVDILLEDVLFHIINELKIKDKAKVLEKGKLCNKCQKINDMDAQFCKSCGTRISGESLQPVKAPQEALESFKPQAPPEHPITLSKAPEITSPQESPAIPRVPQKPPEEASPQESPAIPRVPQKPPEGAKPQTGPASPPLTPNKSEEAPAISMQITGTAINLLSEEPMQSDQDLIKILDAKYTKKYECDLCEIKCAYKDPFLQILNDVKNLKEPFKKFDEFLRTKDLMIFSNYIYNFAQEQMKQYPKYSLNELPDIAYCIFSILSFHILEKADQKIRLNFAEKMKAWITDRFNKENPAISGKAGLVTEDIGAPLPTIKMGLLHIEENRCPFCYRKLDERILKLKIKGYPVNCPNCDHLL
jgi:hypothetical protein